MTSERWQQVKNLLDDTLDRPPEERVAFLHERCPDDAALRKEVRSLIDAYADEEVFFSKGAFGEEGLLPRPEALPEAALDEGATVGPYRLAEVLGRGGMGAVYRAARDDEHYEREVALKVIRPGLYTPEMRRRFRGERQILASLEHPHIARLYDGGLTDDGRPYFAMERVDGTPIDRYCDEHQLSVRERLRLFEKVARAVGHAHRKLVVHRDLKPSNVLVTPEGEPKLLDFGVAKLLDPDARADDAPTTRTGRALMTPEYAAPEQVRGEEITTATDVYALGVLLYRLLTGRRPYRFEKRTPSHVERVICETEPERPSTAAATRVPGNAGDADAASAEHRSRTRSTQPARLRRALRGDLDRIVLKALRKEPARRYGSAAALADDLRRYLDGLPVEARRATWRYRTGKFVRRHRRGVAAAAVLALLLLGYAATVTVQARRLAAERDRVQTEAAKAEHVSDFLVGLFDSSNPLESTGASMSAQELLDRGMGRVSQLEDRPAVQAQMLDAMGRAQIGLGRYPQADSLLRRALSIRRQLYEPPHPDLAAGLDHRAEALRNMGNYAAAESLARKAVAMQTTLRGKAHPDVASSLHDLAFILKEQGKYAPAESLYREALTIKRRVHEGAHKHITATLNNLGQLLTERGEYAAADSLHREALAMRRELFGPAHYKVAESYNNLAQVREGEGRFAEAESLYRKALAIDREALGPRHPAVATTLSNLAVAVERQGRLAEAESMKRQSLAMRRELLGADHPAITISMNNLAVLLRKKEQYEEAASLFRQVLERLRAQYGEQHPYIAFTSENLADTRREQGRYAEADSLYQAALAMTKEVFGEQHPQVAEVLEQFAGLREAQKRYKAAEAFRRQALAIRRNGQGDPAKKAESLRELAHLLMRQEEMKEAEQLYREALAVNQEAFAKRSWHVAYLQSALGECLTAQEHYAAAESLLKEAAATLTEERGPDNRRTQRTRQRLAHLYDAWGKPKQAAAYRDSLRLAKAAPPG